MAFRSRVLAFLLSAFALVGGRSDSDTAAASPLSIAHSELSAARAGMLRLLTYNVAGLPAWFSKVRPRENMAQISPLLNDYELVLVQEDFAYHDKLSERAQHPFRSRPLSALTSIGDGLSAFSAFPFGRVERVAWRDCHGVFSAHSDCLADKGFSLIETQVAKGTTLHVYNVHADAGRRRGDRRARAKGFKQLASYIRLHSRDQALIVAGDTNLKSDPGDQAIFDRFLRATGLIDTCRVLDCGEHGFDKVLTRSSSMIELAPKLWRWEDGFLDKGYRPLSDHPALRVDVAWRNGPAEAAVIPEAIASVDR